MNKIITHLDLDLASSNEYKIINAQQLDNNTRRLEVNLFHEGKIYDISNVTRIELQGSRGDGLVIKTTLSHNGNTIIVDFDDTILGAKGLCKLKIALYNSRELLSSFPFIIRVDENVYDENGIIASPVYSELDEALKKVKDIETKESSRVEAENKRVSSEQARNNAESTRIKAEESRVSSENERRNSETSRVSEFTNMKNELSEIVENNKNINIEAIAPDDEHYQVKVTDKNGTSKTSANLLSKLAIGTVETGEYDEVPTANITGKFGEQKLNLRLPIGKPFKIKKTYSSNTDMNQNIQADLDLYEFCMINTGSVEDEDTAKLYMRDIDGAHYITDLSGAQGIQGVKGETGATPNLTIGTVETGAEGSQATATITGTAENPILNLTIPRGMTGKVENISGASIPYISSDDEKSIKDVVDDKLGKTEQASDSVTVNGHTVDSDVPANAKFTDTDTWRPQPDWNATSGDAVILNKPTSLPASDVYPWAKNATKPTYTASEVGAATSDHTHGVLKRSDNMYEIYYGNDAANEVEGGLNNLVFSSWNGVSFTTNCTSQKYYNKTAVSINCRKGRLTAETIGTSGNMECSDMTIKSALTGIKLKNAYTYPARIYVDDKTLRIMSIGTSSGVNGEWGAGLAISTCAGGIYPIYNYKGNPTKLNYTGNKSIPGVNLGTPSAKFGTIYCENTNSDKKLKKDIKNLKETDLMNKYLEMFNKIDFVKFRWKNNQNSGLETPASSRYHYGIIAQEIEKLLNDEGIGTYDNGIIKSTFFAENTSGAFVTGGYQPKFENKDNGITYDYSENVYNFKHGYDYEVYNEIIEKNLLEINSTGVYIDRNNISYIMIEDNSKLAEGNGRPPVTIKGIVLVDKDGNTKNLSMDYNKCISYYEWNDNDFSNPKTSGTLNEDGSITVSFNKKYGTYMIKVDNFNFFDYEKIILDVDYVGEYKVYLIPEATTKHVNSNVWDRGRVDDIMLIYNVNYQELQIMCLFAAQQIIKQQESEISVLKSEIQGIKELISNA